MASAPKAAGSAVPAPGPRPVTVVVGEEDLLVERAVSAIVAAAGGSGAAAHSAEGTDVNDVAAAELSPGELTGLSSRPQLPAPSSPRPASRPA